MSHSHTDARRATTRTLTKALACLALLLCCQVAARADTFDLVGSSNEQRPLGVPFGTPLVAFFESPFSRVVTVNSAGDTFDFSFGLYRILPSTSFVAVGCSNGPCLTLTGTLNLPSAAPLSFSGVFDVSTGGGTHLTVDWQTGSGPINFTTSQGGTGQFVIELLDFEVTNSATFGQFYAQQARLTVTQFTPAPVPEPATVLLFGAGIAGLASAVRKRRAAAARKV